MAILEQELEVKQQTGPAPPREGRGQIPGAASTVAEEPRGTPMNGMLPQNVLQDEALIPAAEGQENQERRRVVPSVAGLDSSLAKQPSKLPGAQSQVFDQPKPSESS